MTFVTKNPLTPERLTELRQRWAQEPQLSKPQIANLMGVTKGVVCGWIYRNNLPMRPNSGCAARWGSPDVPGAVAKRDERKRAKQAKNTERRRQKRVASLAAEGKTLHRRTPSVTPIVDVPKTPIVRAALRATPRPIVPPPKPPAPKPPAPVLSAGPCRWPTWDHAQPKSAAYWASTSAGVAVECGDPAKTGHPYCAVHCRAAFTALPQRMEKGTPAHA